MWNKIYFHLLFLIIIFIIALLPLYRRISITPAGTYYPWVHRIHEDYYYDLMVIKQGRIGFEEVDQYTTEETSPGRIHPFYLFLGGLGKFTGISDIGMYYASMCGSLALFYLYSYLLVTFLIPGRWRFLAMYLIFFASPLPEYKISFLGKEIYLGASWWTYTDIYSRLTHLPHHFIAVSLILGGLYFVLRFEREKKLLWAFLTTLHLCLALLIFALPAIIFLLALSLVLGITKIREIKHLVVIKYFSGYFFIYIISLIILYYLNHELYSLGFPWSTFLDWEYKWYNHPVEIFPYTFWVYLVSYGILLLFLPAALYFIFKKQSFKKLLIFFMAVLPPSLYLLSAKQLLPIPKVRFVHMAPYFFAGILSTWGISVLFGRIHSKRVRKVCFLLLIGVLLTNTFLGFRAYFWPTLLEKGNERNIYIPFMYLKAIDYLNSYTPRYSSVLATYYVGSYLPAFAFNKVYIGHMVNTYNFQEKWYQVEAFFQRKMAENDAKNLLVSNRLDYVFWDQDEIPASYKNFLEPIFTGESITIYKFIRKRSAI